MLVAVQIDSQGILMRQSLDVSGAEQRLLGPPQRTCAGAEQYINRKSREKKNGFFDTVLIKLAGGLSRKGRHS